MSGGSTGIARPEQHRSQDTLRWGGMIGLGVPAVFGSLAELLANASAHSGSQLVNAHWRWPLTWAVALCVTPRGVTGDIAVQFEIILGSGDAQQSILRTVNVLNGAVDTTVDNSLFLPACDILIRPKVLASDDTHPLTGPGVIEIGAYVAPETEAHAMLEMLNCLCRLEGAGNADQRQGGWMPPGFYPEPLQYGR